MARHVKRRTVVQVVVRERTEGLAQVCLNVTLPKSASLSRLRSKDKGKGKAKADATLTDTFYHSLDPLRPPPASPEAPSALLDAL
ncbi:hypothetical protein FRB99_001260, partial [Tulasnella sp. 403]